MQTREWAAAVHGKFPSSILGSVFKFHVNCNCLALQTMCQKSVVFEDGFNPGRSLHCYPGDRVGVDRGQTAWSVEVMVVRWDGEGGDVAYD